MPWDKGFNFRATSGFIDTTAETAAGQTYVLSSDAYGSTTRNSVAFGWDDVNSNDSRNRDAGIDRRLAGINFGPGGQARTFRVDLPATGDYDIYLALGDYGGSFAGSSTQTIKDNATTLATLTNGPNSGEFIDATDVSRSAAAWPTDNVKITRTFASQIFNLTFSDFGNARIAHLRLVQVEGAPSLAATITTNSGANYSTTDATTDLAGTSSLATSVTWSNAAGGSGTADYAADAWTISGISLTMGANVITVTAHDNGNTATDTITVTRTAAVEQARGFGATLGVGTSDRVVSALTSYSTLRTWSFWAKRRAEVNAEYWNKNNGVEALSANNTSQISFKRVLTTEWLWRYTAPALDTWTNILITYDAGNPTTAPAVYFNGTVQTLIQSIPGTGSVANTGDSNPVVIGNRAAADRAFDGLILEFAIWDRILSGTEITDLATPAGGYDGKSPLYYPTGLVEYISLNDDPVTSKVLADPTVTGTAQQTGLAIDYPETTTPITVSNLIDSLAGGEVV